MMIALLIAIGVHLNIKALSTVEAVEQLCRPLVNGTGCFRPSQNTAVTDTRTTVAFPAIFPLAEPPTVAPGSFRFQESHRPQEFDTPKPRSRNRQQRRRPYFQDSDHLQEIDQAGQTPLGRGTVADENGILLRRRRKRQSAYQGTSRRRPILRSSTKSPRNYTDEAGVMSQLTAEYKNMLRKANHSANNAALAVLSKGKELRREPKYRYSKKLQGNPVVQGSMTSPGPGPGANPAEPQFPASICFSCSSAGAGAVEPNGNCSRNLNSMKQAAAFGVDSLPCKNACFANVLRIGNFITAFRGCVEANDDSIFGQTTFKHGIYTCVKTKLMDAVWYSCKCDGHFCNFKLPGI